MPDLSDKVSDYRLQQIRTMTGGEELPHYEAAAMARELLAYRTRPPASSMEGWRLVPEEPTEAMIDRACSAWVDLHPGFPGEKPEPTAGDVVASIYRAALAASPIPPEVMK